MALFTNISIRTKIAFAPVLLILLLSVFIYTYYPYKQKQELQKAIELNIQNISDMISIGVGIGMGESDFVAISEALEWAKKDSSIAYIQVLDKNNEEIAAYDPHHLQLDINKVYTRQTDMGDDDVLLKLTKEIFYQKIYFGKIILIYSLKPMNESIAALRQTTLYICLAILVCGVLLSLTISSTITNNIRKLSMAVRNINSAEARQNVNIRSRDEIGELAGAFNEMIENLERSNKELLSSKQYTEDIILSMPDMVFVLDEEYNISFCNHAATLEIGYAQEELIGRSIDMIFSSEDTLPHLKTLISNKGKVENKDIYFNSKGRKKIPVLFSYSEIDNDHTKRGFVCVAQNITEIKEAESQLINYSNKLERINKELDNFAYVVSHDLKAPLRAIFKLSEWIQEDMETNALDEIPAKMQLLRGRVLRLEGLINGILDYSKIGKVKVQKEPVDVGNLLLEIIDSLAPPSSFTVDIITPMPTMETEKIRLQQVFSNLISNAIKYNDKKEGHISISAVDKKDHFEFSVADNGPGIDPRFHDKVFGLFQTLEARDKVESTGIGLTIVKKIIEEQKGTIRITSEPEKGATFTFKWMK